MGRLVKRVPLDFDYPINMIWEGYINPFDNSCVQCRRYRSVGYSDDGEYVETALRDFLRTPELKNSEAFRKIINVLIAPRKLEDWEKNTDLYSSHAYSAAINLGKMAGLPDDWMVCPNPKCREEREKCHSFKGTEPPTGEGYQLWENTTEGSPQSPVFESLEELAEWCEKNATTFADNRATKEEWLEMLKGNTVHHQSDDITFF